MNTRAVVVCCFESTMHGYTSENSRLHQKYYHQAKQVHLSEIAQCNFPEMMCYTDLHRNLLCMYIVVYILFATLLTLNFCISLFHSLHALIVILWPDISLSQVNIQKGYLYIGIYLYSETLFFCL